jgi:hypothetical protein
MTESTIRESNFPQPRPIALQASTLSAQGHSENNRSSSKYSHVASDLRQVESKKSQADTTSDKATAAFIRRTLCAHNVLLGSGEKGRSSPRPIEEALPPLTSSNAIDLQLYAIIAVIIKDLVCLRERSDPDYSSLYPGA